MATTEHLYMPADHMDQLYNSPHPLVRFAHRQRLASIVRAARRGSGLKVLDAGCGEGHLLELLHRSDPSREYYGVDATPVAIERAQQRCPFARLTVGDISRLSFADGHFDVITITEVLEHVIEYEDVARELVRVLAPSGQLIITFPNEITWTIGRLLLGRRPIRVVDHVNAFNPKMIERAFGLRVSKRINLPFRLPFALSLGSLMVLER